MTPEEYKKMSEKASPPSPMGKNLLLAFLVGGLICAVGQGIQWALLENGLSRDGAGAATSAVLVFFSALLTGLHLYEKLAKHAGAGTLVPITGFANAMVSPALEFKREGFILGVGVKMFSIAGPVIVYGVAASAVYGLILAIWGAK
ncbi:MAG: stage V sporulation protein AC [Oscillospiraceae bacterium]|nr:stage V sporulation protein AC [Oscillospiraceae bacterium]